jgi:excisionase family DNA binding protein
VRNDITVGEAATIVGLSIARVRALVASKDLRARKIGRDWIIRRKDAEAFASKERRGPGRPRKEVA